MWRSRHIIGTPVWDEMSISYAKLCSCDGDKPISIMAYHNEMGKQLCMGSFCSTVNEVIGAVGGAEDLTLTGQPTACGKIVVNKAYMESKMATQRQKHNIKTSNEGQNNSLLSRGLEKKGAAGSVIIEREEHRYEELKIRLSAKSPSFGDFDINPFFQISCANEYRRV